MGAQDPPQRHGAPMAVLPVGGQQGPTEAIAQRLKRPLARQDGLPCGFRGRGSCAWVFCRHKTLQCRPQQSRNIEAIHSSNKPLSEPILLQKTKITVYHVMSIRSRDLDLSDQHQITSRGVSRWHSCTVNQEVLAGY